MIKHPLQNTENDCHQCLSGSFGVQQIRFRPRLRPDPARGDNSAPLDPLAGLRGPTFKGRGKIREGREREGEERKGKESEEEEGGDAPP